MDDADVLGQMWDDGYEFGFQKGVQSAKRLAKMIARTEKVKLEEVNEN